MPKTRKTYGESLTHSANGGEDRPDPWVLYESEQLPFVALAQLLGCSVVDLWLATSNTQWRVFCFHT